MSLAAVIVAHGEKRFSQLQAIIDSCQSLDEVVVVHDFDPGQAERLIRCAYYHVPAVTRTTIDALMKRDVGWLVTKSDAVCFLSDDHKLAPNFLDGYQQWAKRDDWDFLRPSRYTIRGQTIIPLNNGSDRYGEYCAGHGGVYRRVCARTLPWMAGPHHLNWDLLHSLALKKMHMRMAVAGDELAIEDVEQGARPWE